MTIPDEVLEAIVYDAHRTGCADYMDNPRAYRVRDNLNREAFDAAEASGCCGFGHSHYTDQHGDKWITGWNFGH